MKPREQKPGEVFRILNRETGSVEGSYSRAYCTEYDFASPEEARNANCHGMFRDRAKYGIARYRVTYELIEEDVDPPTQEDVERHLQNKADEAEVGRLLAESDISGVFEKMAFALEKHREIRWRREYHRMAASPEP